LFAWDVPWHTAGRACTRSLTRRRYRCCRQLTGPPDPEMENSKGAKDLGIDDLKKMGEKMRKR
jgi:hypothetical protein